MTTIAWIGVGPGPVLTSETLSQDYDFSSDIVQDIDSGDALVLLRLCSSSFEDLSAFNKYGALGILPTTVLYYAGILRNDPINWSVGSKILVTDIGMLTTNPGSSIQISGGLYATADGLEFRDGTNIAGLETVWADGDSLVLAIMISGMEMRLGKLISEQGVVSQIDADYARGVSVFSYNDKMWAAVSMYTDGLAFFDISDLSNVTHVLTETDGGFFHGGAVKIGSRLFCSARESGLYIYDLTNLGTSALGTPTILACPTAGVTTQADPKVTGLLYDETTDILYIYDRVGGWGAIKDVSVTASGSLAYSTTLRHVSVSGAYNVETHRGDVLTVGSQRLLLVPSLTTNILVIEDVTDETTPVVQSYLPSTSVNYKCWDAKHLHGNFIVCSQWSYETTQRYRAGLAIFDIADPKAPRLCSRWYDPSIPYHGTGADSPPLDIVVRDSVVYVSAGPTGLRVIDCSNPYHPVEVATQNNITRLSADHGYASVCKFNGGVVAVGSNIPTNTGPVAIDIFTGSRNKDPHTPIKFYPYGGKAHYVDEFFVESGPVTGGTKPWASMYFPYTSAPAPEFTGNALFHLSLTRSERAFALLSPCKSMSEVHAKGKLSLDTLPPANGYVYFTIATTRSIASGGATVVFLQLILQSTSDGLNYRVMVKYNNGSALVNTSFTSVSNLFSAGTVYDFSVSWSASGVSFTFGNARTITVSGSFGAANRPKFVGIDANRIDTTTNANFQINLYDRYTINDSSIDWTHSDVTLWTSDTETSRLFYGAVPAVKKDDVESLVNDGDYCIVGGKTILKSTVPPYALGVSIGPEHPERNFTSAIMFGDAVPFDPAAFTPPVPSTGAVGEVKRVFTISGTPSITEINDLLKLGA